MTKPKPRSYRPAVALPCSSFIERTSLLRNNRSNHKWAAFLIHPTAHPHIFVIVPKNQEHEVLPPHCFRTPPNRAGTLRHGDGLLHPASVTQSTVICLPPRKKSQGFCFRTSTGPKVFFFSAVKTVATPIVYVGKVLRIRDFPIKRSFTYQNLTIRKSPSGSLILSAKKRRHRALGVHCHDQSATKC